MEIDFYLLSVRSNQNGTLKITCQSCGNVFPSNVSYELHQFILAYQNNNTEWDIEFKLPKEVESEQT